LCIHLWIDSDAFLSLKGECVNAFPPDQFLYKLILERSASFHSNPVQLLDKK
jgi:hypothetical protein